MTAHFGLDIGSYSIKAVQVEKKGKTYRILGLGEIKTPVNLVSQAETDKKILSETIKRLLNDSRITTKEAFLSLSETAAFSQVIEMPFLSQTELSSAIQFEAEQYVPIPLSEVKLEYVVLTPEKKLAKDEKMEVLLVAAKSQVVNQLSSLSEAAGLFPLAMETEILSLLRIASFCLAKDFLFLNLGHSSSNIILLQNQSLKFVRTLQTGGEALTRAVAQGLNMEPALAEQYKTAYGLLEEALEGKVSKTLTPTFNIIAAELKKCLNFFLQKNPENKINTLVIAGGGAGLPGINSYLAGLLNLEVITFDPFACFAPDKRFLQQSGKARFATAAGLSIREE